jgi:hypothetical protein
MQMYRDIDEGGGEDGGVAAKVSVGKEAAKERREGGNALPVVDAPRSGLQVLVQHPRQVYDQVCRQPEVAQPLAQLHCCIHIYIYMCIISILLINSLLVSVYIW